MTDPTAQGMSVTPDEKPPEHRDVFDYVFAMLMEAWGQGDPPASNPSIPDYIEKARDLFHANQPIAMDYLGQNLALRFQDGMVLTFVDVDTGMAGMGEGGAEASSQPINHPPQPKGGKGSTVPSPSWGVTGNEE